MTETCIERFHQWRVACHGLSGFSIAVFISPALNHELPQALSRYLNEYDEPAMGRWAGFTTQEVQDLSRHEAERNLLGVTSECKLCPAGSICLQKKVAKAMAGIGCAVLEGRPALGATEGLENVFRVALGTLPEDMGEVHLAIQPKGFAAHYLPVLVGDAFLEWAEAHRPATHR